MDNQDDVERLFSWLKTSYLHYREFATQREVADAVATWPALHRAAAEAAPAATPANDPEIVEPQYHAPELPTEPAPPFPPRGATPPRPPISNGGRLMSS